MTVKAPCIKLSDGKQVPLVGLGTWKSKPGEVYESVQVAIDAGYRHIDCALVYQNETEVGRGIREKINDTTVTRDELFVTSKCWNTYHSKDKVIECCKKSLEALGLDYLDLYLIHWPLGYQEGGALFPKGEDGEMLISDVDYVETWKGMEECVGKGLVRSIGLSNFNSMQIMRVLDICSIKPVMLQVECHPYLNQCQLIDFGKKHGIRITAYSPLGSPDRPWVKADEPSLMEDERIKALAEKYGKTPAQILLRYQVQRNVIVIPKSVTKERIENNIQLFDFELSSEEIETLNDFGQEYRFCHLSWMKNHPHYPFNIPY